MINLMKLELKKVGLKRYFLFSILGIFLCMFFVFTGLNDKSTSIYDYDVTFSTISLVFCFYYIILFAVLNVAYIINEYTNKTILILFSYPLDRKKLIFIKVTFDYDSYDIINDSWIYLLFYIRCCIG